jgi:hypothetical protein
MKHTVSISKWLVGNQYETGEKWLGLPFKRDSMADMGTWRRKVVGCADVLDSLHTTHTYNFIPPCYNICKTMPFKGQTQSLFSSLLLVFQESQWKLTGFLPSFLPFP